MIIDAFFFVLGTIVGSFLNVCIVRMPHEKSVVKPRSHCVKCKIPIKWHDNIPLISFLLLRGKCRNCGEKFSFRYFLIELLTGLAFMGFYKFYGLDILLVPYLFMTSCFIVATFVDFEHRIIPDEISVGGMFVGLAFSAILPQMHGVGEQTPLIMMNLKSLSFSVMGVLIGGGTIYAMGVLGDIMFKKESMGGGDIKLLAMIGAFLGWKYALLTFFIAPVFGAVYGIIEKIRTKDSAIAYGPFLCLAALICLFWGHLIINWLTRGCY